MHMLHRPNPLDHSAFRRPDVDFHLAPDPIVRALVEARLAWRFSQTEIAKRMGVPSNYICRLETGERVPSLAMLRRWAGALGYDLGLRTPTEAR